MRLRTPLTAVIGWTQFLSAGQLDEDGRARALQAIQRNAYAQSQSIEVLLNGFQMHLPRAVEPAELAAVVASLAGRTVKSN
jgi:signal transduction histidine kinase